jgi:ankyrin repeat protein
LLSDAARNGHTAVVKLLYSLSDIDINRLHRQGMTPLLISVLKQHRDVVELLISVKGINVNFIDKYG